MKPIWGENDCCLFAGAIVEAVTGVDPAALYRGTYSTKLEAEQIVAEAGGIEALVERQLANVGLPVERWPDPRLGQRGDPMVFDMGNGAKALGVCYTGARIAALTETVGIFLPVKRGLVAWRI